jgi:hypothetical protein
VTHDERDDVHRPAGHAPLVQVGHDPLELGRGHPVIGESGVRFVFGRDEGAVLNAGNVTRVGRAPVGVRLLGLVELDERARRDECGVEAVALLLGAITPNDLVRGGEGGNFVDPGL